MGLQYEYFTAENDEAAIAAFGSGATWPPPTFPNEEIRLDELDDLEYLLTGRSVQEIREDPRFNAQIAEQVDEDAGVAECGLVAVTDAFTRALAVADLSALPEAYHDYVTSLRELAGVARHAMARGHRMYCFWVV